MPPIIWIVAGLGAFGVGILILRTYGAGYRIGRSLATARQVSVAEARTLALGPARYVRVDGRIDAEDEFEDDAHRPLVFRRTRLQRRDGAGWVAFEDRRERVPFEIRDGMDGIVVDDAALEDGLVVIPRESTGTAADVAEHVPAGTEPTTRIRLLVEQISSVEHAIVVGVPTLDPSGEPRLSAGLGRPLILTTLDRDEAMRILVGGERRRPRLAAACMVGGLALIIVGLVSSVVGAVL